MKQQLFSAMLVASLVIPGMGKTVNTLLVTIDDQVIAFEDVTTDQWFATYVKAAAEAGVITGYKDAKGNLTGTFGPADNVTFAQAIKIAIEAAGYSVTSYSDSKMYPTHWASKYMQVAAENHFDVITSGVMNIDRPATRAEVAAITRAAFNVKAGSIADMKYMDVNGSTPYATAIAALTRDDIVSGDKDADGALLHRYRPGSPVNRAETTKVAMEARATYGQPGQKAMSSSLSVSSRASSLSSSAVSSSMSSVSSSAVSSSSSLMSSSSASAVSSASSVSSSLSSSPASSSSSVSSSVSSSAVSSSSSSSSLSSSASSLSSSSSSSSSAS